MDVVLVVVGAVVVVVKFDVIIVEFLGVVQLIFIQLDSGCCTYGVGVIVIVVVGTFGSGGSENCLLSNELGILNYRR